jgi:hypothetical protein
MLFNIYNVFYSKCSHQHVAAAITAIFRVMLMLQKYKNTNAVKCFFLNNQPDAPIIQIYSVIKLYMFRASSLSIIRSFLLYFHAGF